MTVKLMTHTGFVVSDLERSLEFYRDLLGLKVKRSGIAEGEFNSQALGYPGLKLNKANLSMDDEGHEIELIQYLNPEGGSVAPIARNDVGASHLGLVVDDLDSLRSTLEARGAEFAGPPVHRPEAVYPDVWKSCYVQDPDGNWLEIAERAPAPAGS